MVLSKEKVRQVEKNIAGVLDNIENVLNIIQNTLQSKELTINPMISKKRSDYGVISEDFYFNSIVIHCIKTVDSMFDLVNEATTELI